MNMKFTSISLLIAAVAGISFSQAAHAGNTMRFDYAANEYALEQPTGHRGRFAEHAPRNVVAPIAAGVAPKMKGFDDNFVSKPAPPPPAPVVAAVPVARPSVSAQVKVPNAFTSLFNPVKSEPALVANAPGQLPLPAFGSPNVARLPVVATPKAPGFGHSTHTSATLLTPQRRRPVAAIAAPPAFKLPETKGYNAGYTPGAAIPMASSAGSSTSANVHGVVVSHH